MMTARDYYQAHRQKIEHWLDVAVYPETEQYGRTEIPHKVSQRHDRTHRRGCLLRDQMRLQRVADLTRSRRVLDIGAGYGDFAIFADNFRFERLDATDPGGSQYRFLTEQWRAYDRVYDLPLQDMDLSGYDTLVLLGVWVPDWVATLRDHLLVHPGLRDVVMSINTWPRAGMVYEADADQWTGPWSYSHRVDRVMWYSEQLINSVFRNSGFHRAQVFRLARSMDVTRVWLHYQRPGA